MNQIYDGNHSLSINSDTLGGSGFKPFRFLISGIACFNIDDGRIRMVTHLNFNDDDLSKAEDILKTFQC